jgi:hypothetical protein
MSQQGQRTLIQTKYSGCHHRLGEQQLSKSCGVIAKVCVGDSIVSTALSVAMAAVGLVVAYVLVASF